MTDTYTNVRLWALYLPLVAAALDLALGDPPWLWHPVRGLGWVAERMEPRLRRQAERFGPRALKAAGGLGVCLLVFGAALAAFLLARTPRLGPYLALYLAFAGLALGQLLRECAGVVELIGVGSLAPARNALSFLVSRDTSSLDRPGLGRALAETLSENLNDGFVAPFFFLILGGLLGGALFGPENQAACAVGLLWGYKAASTLDSMWGYKTERWRDFGWAAARLDDALAFVPARLSALALLTGGELSARLSKATSPVRAAGGWRLLWRRLRADAAKSESPNAGWPMAAAAWIMRRRVGGPATYFGRVKEKPWLGPETPDARASWDGSRVRACLQLTFWAGCLSAGVLWLGGVLLDRLLS